MNWFLAYDIGAISVKRVLLKDGQPVSLLPYTRHHGQPFRVILNDLEQLVTFCPVVLGLGFTGCGGKYLAGLVQAEFVPEFEALVTGVKTLYPHARTVIEIGGEHSRFIDLVSNDFYMNELCAAGTGSFLDQQASRFNLSVEEFSTMALKARRPATIAGRCSVFAKSDMIHLQQEGTPDEEIALGLCYAVARSFKAGIAKGKDFLPPVIFCGGVAFNPAIVRALEEIGRQALIIPEDPASVSAIGTALIVKNRQAGKNFILTEVRERLGQNSGLSLQSAESLPKLKILISRLPTAGEPNYQFSSKPIETAIGIDVGSISTNLVAIDASNNLIAKVYLRTAGRPIEAVKKGISLLYQKVGKNLRVVACGTTGSGRYLIGDLVGADTVINEITAQATAAAHIDPEVDTIFEIGGQDSKYIYLKNGVVVDFEMNKICAAGTGSFLEEQAERFQVPIEDFGEIALSAKSPVNLGERCTVFMETNVYAHYQKGAGVEDILAGLAYSIVTNYLNRVVGRKKIGRRIFFQGAVAFNQAVVAAFEKTLSQAITVPLHHEVTGAIGAAMVALKNQPEKTRFRGFEEIANLSYQQSSFECQSCANRCEIRKVSVKESTTQLFYGGRCEKYETTKARTENIPDLFAERNTLLFQAWPEEKQPPPNGEKIGLPLVMLTYEFLPFWIAFFSQLGFSLILSEPSNKKIIAAGLEAATAETCFPVKVMLGHVQSLLEKKVDYLFLPVIRDMPCDFKKIFGTRRGSYTCPYVQAISAIVKSSLKVEPEKILDPVINFSYRHYVSRYQLSALGKRLGRGEKEISRAIKMAYRGQGRFKQWVRDRGEMVFRHLPDKAIVVLGRPYNCCDRAVSMDIPEKLRRLGFWVLPLDYLPLEKVDLFPNWPNLYWEFGYRMMSALEIIKNDPRLYSVYITNFGCGPDSFLLQYFERGMGKPFLKIEVDEHTAGAGVITRCEAFVDSLKNFRHFQKQGLWEGTRKEGRDKKRRSPGRANELKPI
ncbi:MAG: acyl-CoA dehydratase activase [Candidatus Omnitrophica bacterium]|nr:acyl-CoA dehydratase activase [Candidatus Omnitrophota bacterium]